MPPRYRAARPSDFASGQTATESAKISDGTRSGTKIKAGAGTLTLSGTNTYTGGTAVNGGTLIITSDAIQVMAPCRWRTARRLRHREPAPTAMPLQSPPPGSSTSRTGMMATQSAAIANGDRAAALVKQALTLTKTKVNS